MSIEDLNSKEELGRFVVEYLEANPLPQSAVSGLQELITQGRWTALNLLNGFSNYASGFSPAAWCSIPGGGVMLRGLIQKPEAAPLGTVIAQLPRSLAPKERLPFDPIGAIGGGAQHACRVDVDGEGNIIYAESEATVQFLGLQPIVFWPGS